MKNNNKDWGELKKKISETLVKYSMPTRQVAINEILSHFSLRLQEIKKELEGKKEKDLLEWVRSSLEKYERNMKIFGDADRGEYETASEQLRHVKNRNKTLTTLLQEIREDNKG